MYKLTEKFLMLFPFYRERVRVMDAYAVRLSEAVEALKAANKERDALRDALTTSRTLSQALLEDIAETASAPHKAEEINRTYKFQQAVRRIKQNRL